MLNLFAALGLVEKALNKKDILLVEYGKIFHLRLRYPATFEWAIPDSQLPLVSETLLEHGIPLSSVLKSCAKDYSEQETIDVMHYYAAMCIHLIPLFYMLLSLNVCVRVLSTVNLQQSLLVPNPQRYLLYKIKKLLSLPLSMQQHPICSDITQVLSRYVFSKLPDNIEDKKSESKKHFNNMFRKHWLLCRAGNGELAMRSIFILWNFLFRMGDVLRL
ncbi:uncharacterized protein CIMG_13129 [Coccidioides immitis RS]|uniref:Uncharacterized protein n=1 Tax=Coccidioides immitis (strain RS) TaxID=246410 RepID=J3K9Y4_COCIM|nr:uncharacterized protein CIMG_13129 [Coccidioides immitis RS]EAS31772.3 hypothetical protein CIMG_13129 [Coccidioides immitis RS]